MSPKREDRFLNPLGDQRHSFPRFHGRNVADTVTLCDHFNLLLLAQDI
jgi:hypothetical protein